ncbi:hypothetical protein E0Z10_g7410 [Xylaria hypoxylon]|uniref:HTH CENPB-type domain-containing protein n=1 Tax=Xylaria hypoxylon TaxID=37992 RepID=A0A4Z0YMP6_9PEZI|nr:hypothetical protein E0Z10_g7410 [Xylaria hypoxylon]
MSSTETPKRHQNRALEAAQWLYETQKAQLAEDPNRPRASISSTRAAAEKFGVSKSTVARQLVALKNGKPNASTGSRVGRPGRLSEVEEKMLSFHMFMLRREKRPVSLKVVQDAADALLSRRKPPGAPISGSWVRRWLRADRAQAREEAMSKDNGPRPNAELVEAEANDDDEDGDLGEEGPSEDETTDANLDPSIHENLFLP